jgi:hypothetical protein
MKITSSKGFESEVRSPCVRSVQPDLCTLSCSDDAANTAVLRDLVPQIPVDLRAQRGATFPLLESLSRADADRGTRLTRDLLCLAAVIHRDADERRTAEYLLRHRAEVASGLRSADWLLSSARCASEMDTRRLRSHEAAVGDDALARISAEASPCRPSDPSIGETVVGYLEQSLGYTPTNDVARNRLLDAVVIAMELAERHWLKRGRGPSVLAMRTDARRDARLVTHLRDAFRDTTAARSIARVLVGGDDAPIETSLLWVVAHASVAGTSVPERTRKRWLQDLHCAERGLVASADLAA